MPRSKVDIQGEIDRLTQSLDALKREILSAPDDLLTVRTMGHLVVVFERDGNTLRILNVDGTGQRTCQRTCGPMATDSIVRWVHKNWPQPL